MIHSFPKNKVNVGYHASFKFTVSIVEIINTFRAVLMLVYIQGHCWPQADFEDVSSGVCVCLFLLVG